MARNRGVSLSLGFLQAWPPLLPVSWRTLWRTMKDYPGSSRILISWWLRLEFEQVHPKEGSVFVSLCVLHVMSESRVESHVTNGQSWSWNLSILSMSSVLLQACAPFLPEWCCLFLNKIQSQPLHCTWIILVIGKWFSHPEQYQAYPTNNWFGTKAISSIWKQSSEWSPAGCNR